MRSAPSFCAPYLTTADPIVGKCCPGVACSGREATAEAPSTANGRKRGPPGRVQRRMATAVTGWRSCVGQQVGGSVRSDQRATARGSVAAPLRPHMAHSRPRRDRPVPAAPSRYGGREPSARIRLPRSARRRAADHRRDRGARWDAAGAGARRVRRRCPCRARRSTLGRRVLVEAYAHIGALRGAAAEKAPDGRLQAPLGWPEARGGAARHRGHRRRGRAVPVAAEGVADRGTS